MLVLFQLRVYLEARRLERRPLVTQCSLNLCGDHFPENHTGNHTEELDDYVDNPDIIIISASANKETQIEQISHKKREVSSAKKL